MAAASELYRKRGTNQVFRMRSISIDGRAVASLAGVNVKMVIKVAHCRLATDYEVVRSGERGSEWVNTRTGALVEFVRFSSRGVEVRGPKRGEIVARVLDHGEWGQHYVPLDEWNP